MEKAKRELSAEEKAEWDAKLDAIIARAMPRAKPVLPKPKAVTRDGVVVREADVPVHPQDPNAAGGAVRVVQVRRRDDRYVTINYPEAERQWAEAERAREHGRSLDPFRLGLWGPVDE